MIKLKTEQEILKMEKSGQIVAKTLSFLKNIIVPGISTLDIENAGMDFLKSKYPSVVPAFKGYQGFPAAFCISLNDEVVHGIPSKDKIIQEGDIVSIDFGVINNGFYGDSAFSVIAGKDINKISSLLETTETALLKGIEKATIGNHLSDISAEIERHVKENGYSVVRDFVGHGIGTDLHEDPQVPNFYTDYAKSIELKEGLVIAIEPMVNIGKHKVKVLSDNWTVVTKDGTMSAHFEHTIAISKNGPRILTRREHA